MRRQRLPVDAALGRRAFLTGALSAGAVLLVGPAAASSAAATARPAQAGRAAGEDVASALADLTVRWRHLDVEVVKAGLWADLLAAWTFDEGSGYSFADSSSNGVDLHVTGDAWNTTESGLPGAVHRAGLRGRAVFLGGTRWLEAAATTVVAPDDGGLTLTVWVRLDAVPPRDATLMQVGTGVSLVVDADGRARLSVTDGDDLRHVVDSAVTLPTSVWTHVAATFDPAAGKLRLFVDGAPAGRLSGAAFSMPAPEAASLVLGRGLLGLLDQATLHRGALSPASVAKLRLVGLPRVFAQSRESVDVDREVFTRFKGSDPVPHPIDASTVLSLRLAGDLVSDQAGGPLHPVNADFVPTQFGGGWRATGTAATYPSPLTASSGTFEAWYRAVDDPSDPGRDRRRVVFSARARTSQARLVLTTQDGRWRIELTSSDGRQSSAAGPVQPFPAGVLAHVAVAWGAVDGRPVGVHLLIDGRPAAYLASDPDSTRYDGTISVGGTARAPADCVFDDVRLSDVTLGWGGVCPRGQAATDAAGLDLRDFFQRKPGIAPLWWRPSVGGVEWTVARRTWQHPSSVGDDPGANLAVRQPAPSGVQALFHPDAFGHASSIEAGVSLEEAVDGWAGVFVQSAGPRTAFAGVTFMIDAARNEVRLARYQQGQVVTQKSLPYDFQLSARKTYELTLTCANDGVVRGFLDQTNVVSMTADDGWPSQGFAGLVTDGAAATFSAVHFTALTPAAPDSRIVQTRTATYPPGAANATSTLTPFRWHKRRGLLPWEYDAKDPEPPGNIAGADATYPPHPILAARWRSEDSANSDLIVVDGRVWYVMRGNPRIDGRAGQARVGMLRTEVESFDAVHFADPNQHTGRVRGGPWLLTAGTYGQPRTGASKQPNLNAPSTAYVGGGKLLFLGRESDDGTDQTVGLTVFARFDAVEQRWLSSDAGPVAWNDVPLAQRLRASPELISVRDPVTDAYQGVVFQQQGAAGDAFMATALVDGVEDGVPSLAAGSVRTSLQRSGKGAIYGFRVMFDNGIYYLHYNEGTQVPDWPDRFVLAAALDPHEGPWVRNEETDGESSTYFRRGTEFEPDNGAIWQGTMVKLRGHYYLYYENYHSIGDVDAAYADYGAVQAGSRVGFATA